MDKLFHFTHTTVYTHYHTAATAATLHPLLSPLCVAVKIPKADPNPQSSLLMCIPPRERICQQHVDAKQRCPCSCHNCQHQHGVQQSLVVIEGFGWVGVSVWDGGICLESCVTIRTATTTTTTTTPPPPHHHHHLQQAHLARLWPGDQLRLLQRALDDVAVSCLLRGRVFLQLPQLCQPAGLLRREQVGLLIEVRGWVGVASEGRGRKRRLCEGASRSTSPAAGRRRVCARRRRHHHTAIKAPCRDRSCTKPIRDMPERLNATGWERSLLLLEPRCAKICTHRSRARLCSRRVALLLDG